MLDSLTSTFLERVSFEVALTSERSNTVQKKFNAVGTIMLPLLVTQGLFTMNVKVLVPLPARRIWLTFFAKVPGSDVDNLDWFIAIVSVSAAVFVVAFAVFRRFDWL
jgi:Mg2+ and Co2+ transporter CorA